LAARDRSADLASGCGQGSAGAESAVREDERVCAATVFSASAVADNPIRTARATHLG